MTGTFEGAFLGANIGSFAGGISYGVSQTKWFNNLTGGSGSASDVTALAESGAAGGMANRGLAKIEQTGENALGEMENAALQAENAGANTAKEMAGLGTSPVAERIELSLKYKEGWSLDQIAQADAKVAALNEAAAEGVLQRTTPLRGSTSAKATFEDAGFSVPEAMDVDHVIDLQLGGANTVANMRPLNYSVNRSLGVQIYHATKNVPVGTRVSRVSIGW